MASSNSQREEGTARREPRSRSPEHRARDRPREPRDHMDGRRGQAKERSASPSNPNKRKHDERSRRRSEHSHSRSRSRTRSRSASNLDGTSSPQHAEGAQEEKPPLPNEALPPPLPNEAVPAQGGQDADDGWEPVWEPSAQSYYFYNRFTQTSQWDNPRVPGRTGAAPSQANPPPPGTTGTASDGYMDPAASTTPDLSIRPAAAGGYNPAIHGDYDPNADYAIEHTAQPVSTDPSMSFNTGAPSTLDQQQSVDDYSATAAFNRYTSRFQNTAVHPTHDTSEHTDEAKSRRQMNAFFDVDAAANAHDGRSLKEERRGKRLTKEEVRGFREKKKTKKEERRRAWLRD